jgi:thioredoxin reductase (NADPH)
MPKDCVAPQLSEAQFRRVVAYASSESVAAGDVLFDQGDVEYDVIVIETGWVEIISPATKHEPESVVAHYGPGGVLGELDFLTGQTAHLTARARTAGVVHRITAGQFRRLMATEPDVSHLLLHTFLARRAQMRTCRTAGCAE